MGQLVTPMLYTSLTSAAGFFSLILTPIPPVRVFGAFVRLGILLAFVLTVLVIPAYLASLSEAQLAGVLRARERANEEGSLARSVRILGALGSGAPRTVLGLAVALFCLGAAGISLIEINDNLMGAAARTDFARLERATNAYLRLRFSY